MSSISREMEESTAASSTIQPETTTAYTNTMNQTRRRPHIVLLLENSRKNNNWGPMLRCASAFGIQTVVFIGFAQCSVRGSHGADQHVEIIAFPTIQQAIHFLRYEYNDHNENNDTSTTSSTTMADTKILGLLGAVPGGYSSDGCALRLIDDSNDDEGANEIDQSSNPAGLVQAVVKEYHMNDSSTRRTLSPSLLSSHRSYPVSSTDRMRRMLLPTSSSSENELMKAGVEKQQQEEETRTKTIVLAISKDLHGLPMNLAQHCEAFCHVPHVAFPGSCASSCDDDSSGTAQKPMLPALPRPLLDLPTTLSIALHHITAHLGYREGEFQGHKFQVCSKKKTSLQNEKDCHDQRKKQEHRAQEHKRQEQLVSDAMDNGGLFLWQQEEQNDDY